MEVSLSIKGVPEALAERLRRRATANHRSLQRELMAIVEAAATSEPTHADPAGKPLIVREQEARYVVDAADGGGADDSLLAELDAIVGGSAWGQAPLLTRDEAHDRERTRDLDLDARAQELARAQARARQRKRGTAAR